MFGKNPIEKYDATTGEFLYIHEIFYTVQGEGPFIGMPAVFIRLAGCNLRCFWCDTDFSNHQKTTVEEIVTAVHDKGCEHGRPNPLIVITGGEPFRQNMEPLIRRLLHERLHVQIETAGSLWNEEMELLPLPLCQAIPAGGEWSIVVSPKTPTIRQAVADRTLAYKYVARVGELSEEDGLPIYSTQEEGQRSKLYRPVKFLGFNHAQPTIYISPCDDGDAARNKANQQAALESCMRFGYRLTMQMHKAVGVA